MIFEGTFFPGHQRVIKRGNHASLHINVPLQEGILRVSRVHHYPNAQRRDNFLLNLLRLSLTWNDFAFGDRWFLQPSEIPSPIYTSESERLSHWLPFCHRYQDDVFMVWDHSEPAFRQFIAFLKPQILTFRPT